MLVRLTFDQDTNSWPTFMLVIYYECQLVGRLQQYVWWCTGKYGGLFYIFLVWNGGRAVKTEVLWSLTAFKTTPDQADMPQKWTFRVYISIQWPSRFHTTKWHRIRIQDHPLYPKSLLTISDPKDWDIWLGWGECLIVQVIWDAALFCHFWLWN